jgi:hypothetical protein
MNAITVGCHCGETQIQIAAEPMAQLHCHCDDCQKAHSAAYISAVLYPANAVTVLEGEPVAFVQKRTPRMRCPLCGTFLFSELSEFGLRSVNAYILPAGYFQPQFHVQCQYAVHPIADNLPHYKAFPAKFGGSDEQVNW